MQGPYLKRDAAEDQRIWVGNNATATILTWYHTIRLSLWSMLHYLADKKFGNISKVEAAVKEFVDLKPESFYKSGIEKLVQRWGNILENEGKYILD